LPAGGKKHLCRPWGLVPVRSGAVRLQRQGNLRALCGGRELRRARRQSDGVQDPLAASTRMGRGRSGG